LAYSNSLKSKVILIAYDKTVTLLAKRDMATTSQETVQIED